MFSAIHDTVVGAEMEIVIIQRRAVKSATTAGTWPTERPAEGGLTSDDETYEASSEWTVFSGAVGIKWRRERRWAGESCFRVTLENEVVFVTGHTGKSFLILIHSDRSFGAMRL